MPEIHPTPDEANGFLKFESPASGPDEVRRRHESNRIGWNEGAASFSAEVEAGVDTDDVFF